MQPRLPNLAKTITEYICASENKWYLFGLHVAVKYWSEEGLKRGTGPGEQPGALLHDQQSGKSKLQLT